MVGGASFFGGRVSVVGTAAGALLLTLIGNGIDLLHVNGFLNDDVLGVIVLLVVGSWSLARRPRRGQRVVS
jgi:ribose transport system permease protein